MGETSLPCCISELIALLFRWPERSILGMCNLVISADHLFFCPHIPPPPLPKVFGNYILWLKYLSCSSQSVISLPVSSQCACAYVPLCFSRFRAAVPSGPEVGARWHGTARLLGAGHRERGRHRLRRAPRSLARRKS